jgi:hypothetical protein
MQGEKIHPLQQLKGPFLRPSFKAHGRMPVTPSQLSFLFPWQFRLSIFTEPLGSFIGTHMFSM